MLWSTALETEADPETCVQEVREAGRVEGEIELKLNSGFI